MQTTPYILLVDDDEDDRFLMNLAFHDHCPELLVKFVHSGEELFLFLENLAPEFYPSVIILDYNTPRLNGAETLLRLKQTESYKDITTVVYSTGMDQLKKEHLSIIGAAATLTKPFAPDEWIQFTRQIKKLIVERSLVTYH